MYRIQLSKGLTAVVSEIDYAWAMQFKWSASEQSRSGSGLFYAIRRSSGKGGQRRTKIWLHVEIMKRVLNVVELPRDFVPDHGANGTLDCTRENLTLCKSSTNKINGFIKAYKHWASNPDDICL